MFKKKTDAQRFILKRSDVKSLDRLDFTDWSWWESQNDPSRENPDLPLGYEDDGQFRYDFSDGSSIVANPERWDFGIHLNRMVAYRRCDSRMKHLADATYEDLFYAGAVSGDHGVRKDDQYRMKM